METAHTTEESSARAAAVNALAVVGFLALVFIGIMLAIYAARYVPLAVTRLGSAAYLAGHDEGLAMVPDTTLPFPVATTTNATSTAPAATTTAANSVKAAAAAQPIVGYHTVTSATPTPGATRIEVPTTYTGLPNLIVSITAVGYLDDNDNFVADRSLSSSDTLVVKILVTNSGTNKTGPWSIHTVIPAASDATYEHDEDEPSLEPHAVLPLTLTMTRGSIHKGSDEEISVTVDSDNDVAESNENDNDASATIDVK